ncbi:hypothetical protein [Peribacillus simplex]|uniref:Uncharacterized protein n=1 Tax=Peribacillus simplex TaxID=1478 RepID=A0A9W4L0E9_9BACI|nr:hypothetical protein [Peribacillus simplex]CAH0260871.1 hypothetical protein SRABI133_03385 [Peribacillus simplex]
MTTQGSKFYLFTFAIILVIVSFANVKSASADVFVKGHFRNGKFVAPYFRRNPDSSFSNNFSTYGNINPYTGEVGTKMAPSYNYSYDKAALDRYEYDLERLFEDDKAEPNPQEEQDKKEATEMFNAYIENINYGLPEISYTILEQKMKDKYTVEQFSEPRMSSMYEIHDISSHSTDTGVTVEGNWTRTDTSTGTTEDLKFRYEMIKEDGEWKLSSRYTNE